MDSKPTVFIVDDDPSVCKALRALLHSVNLPTETFASGKDFLDQVTPDQPGCLVMDLRMPGMSGLEVQEVLRNRGVNLPIIIITAHGDVSCAVRAIKAGAIDFLEKPFRGQELLDCVNRALEQDARQRAKRFQNKITASQLETLTPGERAVLDLMAAGRSYKEIASKLNLSYKTVEARRTRIMIKLQVDSLPELMHKVITFSAHSAAQ